MVTGACLGKSEAPSFPDDSIHVALNKHRNTKAGAKKKNAASYAKEYVPRAPHPLMNKENQEKAVNEASNGTNADEPTA